ncbi:MAG: hypothetical protein LBJ00_01615 [Planctomycetaceae bacterium]|jgi:hypothetical protein|nr:hypothetical protein [Planctomycetaceae bacterium]
MSKKKSNFSPFAVFRQHQVASLAAIALMAMISFIILPAFMQLMPGIRYGEGQGNIAVTRHHGKVDPLLLDNLRRNRENLARFYQRLWMVIVQSNPSILTSQSQQSRLGLIAMKAERLAERASDEELINNWLIARYSEDQGIVITSGAIIKLLEDSTDKLITKQNLVQVIEELNIREQDLEYLIGEELRQNQMMYLFVRSQGTVLPSTRWDWFQRLSKQITLEVATLPVSAFVDKVPEPTTAQIKRFFEDNKKREFNPTRPETGFAIPKQIAFSYIKGIPSPKLLESISKQEIEKYYEENKDASFLKPVPQKKDLPTLPGMAPGNFQINESLLNANPINIGNLGTLGNIVPAEQSSNTPIVTSQPETTLPEPKNETTTETTDKPKEPNDEKNTNTEGDKVEKGGEGNNFAQIIRYDNSSKLPDVKLISFQNEPAVEVKEPVASSPTEKVETKEAVVEDQNVAKPTEDKTTEVKPVDDKATEAKPTENNAVTEKVDGGVVDSGKYKPLSEVEDQIRRYLAQVKIDSVLVEVEEKLREHYDVYRKYVDLKIEKPKEAILPPAPPSLSSIVERCDLSVVSVGLSTIFDVMRQPEITRDAEGRDFVINWFRGRPYEYQSSKIGSDFSRTLIWATDFKDAEVPQKVEGDNALSDMVIKRWKEVGAREIAFEEARKLANTATAVKESLAVVFANSELLKVTETEPFTWMTFGYAIDAGSPIRLGEVREKGVSYGEAESGNKHIFAPGEEFMQAASNLENNGEVTVVFNQPKDTVHIIRLVNASPSEDELWERFKTVAPQVYSQIGQQEKLFEAREAWLEEIRAEMDFKWINKPTEE